MKIKKYEASDIKEALKLIKEELGPDAVILSTRKIMKNSGLGLFGKPVLEVTAAVDYKTPEVQPASRRKPSPQRRQEKKETDYSLYMPKQNEPDNAYSSYIPSSAGNDNAYSSIIPNRRKKTSVPDVKEKGVSRSEDSNIPFDYDETPVIKSRPYGYGSYVPLEDPEDRVKEYVELAPPVKPAASDKKEKSYAAFIPKEDEPKESEADKITAVLKSLGLDKLPNILNDIGDIKKQLNDMKSGASSNIIVDLSPRIKEYYAVMIKNGVDEVVAYRFLKGLEKRLAGNLTAMQVRNAIIDMMSDIIPVEKDYSSIMSRRIIALAGPTGVGKTTTIAKIAANLALKFKKKICLITCDNFRIGAIEQLQTYAQIVNIPLYVAANPDELKRIIWEVRGKYDCVLLDSMGRSQFDTEQIKNLSTFFGIDSAVSVALVLSLAANHGELNDTVERYSPLHPEYLIFTKLDETRYYGPLVNLPVKKEIPLLLITTGQNVPDDMETPDGKKIAKKILQEIPTLWSDK